MLYTHFMSAIAYKSNRNVSYSCKYHVVWCPKYRRKVLIQAIAERLKQIIFEVCQEHQAEIFSLEIMSICSLNVIHNSEYIGWYDS
jgi:putative transposase